MNRPGRRYSMAQYTGRPVHPIHARRVELGLTYMDLIRQPGISGRAVHAWVEGRATRQDWKERIAAVLETTIEALEVSA